MSAAYPIPRPAQAGPKLRRYVVPVVHVVHFGLEVVVEARSMKEAAKLARDTSAEPVDGYDWCRADTVEARLGTWDKIKRE